MHRPCPSVRLFSALLCLVVVVSAPLDAEARTRDTLVGDTSSVSSSAVCRGHKFLANQDTIVEDFTVTLQNSSGKTLDWYVYEGATASATFTRVAENQTTGNAGASYTLQSSGPLFANVSAGNYYVLAVCWQATSAITMNYGTSTPTSPSWASWTSGTASSAPAGATQTFGTNFYKPQMQIFTSAGSSISSGEVGNSTDFNTSYTRGHVYEVTKDTVLTEVRQYVQGRTSGGSFAFSSFSVPWHIYRRAGSCSSNQPFTQVTSYTGIIFGTGGTDVTSWAYWSPNLTMEAGYCYFIGIDFNGATSSTGVHRYYYESGAPTEVADWGESKGYAYINASGTPSATENVAFLSSRRGLQRIGAVRDTIDSDTAAGTFSASAGSEFGNIIEVTSPTHISEMAVQIDPDYAGVTNLAIYESSAQSGTYTRIWQGEVEHDNQGKGWLYSQEVGVDLDPASLGGTGYYLFAAEIEGAGVLYRDLSLGTSPAFGTAVGAHWANATSLGFTPTMSAGFQARHYDWRIVSCDTCVDLDGDGFELSEDCDDDDATVNPGETEVCDGVDTDCDGGLLAGGESDTDSDGQRICDGDCDDNDANSYVGATEICDGNDNDCNGTTPTSEQDNDQDGYVPCDLDINPSLTGLAGGGDCDDSSSAVTPGLAVEACDQDDGNCDGYAWIGSTGETSGQYAPVGSAFVGRVVEATVDTVIQGINASLIIAQPNTLTFAVYEASSPTGPWNLVEQQALSATSAGAGPRWYGDAPGNFATPVTAGMYYLAGVHWSGSAAYGAQPQGATYPWATAFGDQVGVYGAFGSTPPTTFSGNLTTSTNVGVRIYTDSELDADGDGYVQCAECDDADDDVFPGAPELCDALDNDCDGTVPADEVDGDSDGELACSDCNDANAAMFTGNPEICDGLDNNCDGAVPSSGTSSENDTDADGQRVCGGDCDDGDPLIGTGFVELCDGNDSDCSGGISANEVDNDGDGYIECVMVGAANPPVGVVGGEDCDDAALDVYPGAPELCDGATIDNDCDGTASDEGADSDGDGSNTCVDCDDNDANVEPGAAEICDGKDNDCDGSIPANEQDPDGDGYIQCSLAGIANPPAFVDGGGDCAVSDADTYPGAAELCDSIDNNCDGTLPVNEQDVDNDNSMACAGDCDDSNSATYPGASEACDGEDNDCNGNVPTNESDGDSDGQRICGGDCNDGNASVYTGNTEVCDGIDNDCDSTIDDGFDGDGDGFFDGSDSGCASTYAANADCDDGAVSIFPGATEVCNGVDTDCDGSIDDGFDGDGDTYFDGADAGCASTYGANADCDDGSASVYPGAAEVCDGVDQDCDSTIDDGFDGDGDGYFDGSNSDCAAAYGASADCDDAVVTTNPGATESCNGVDDDCDSTVDDGFDVDGDGFYDAGDAGCAATYGAAADCDDSEVISYPGAPEACDLADNDCDGAVDEDFDQDGDGYFDFTCPSGDDCDDNDPSINPAGTETCDGVDQDCDGAVDNGFDGDGDGYYDASEPLCATTWGALADCDDADASINPFEVELCDGIDQNCNTLIDEEFDQDGDGYFDDSDPTCTTTYAAAQLDCDDAVATTYAGAPELCNGVDDDCDSPTEVDEGFDADGDGFYDGSVADCVTTYGTVDCDDAVGTIFPGAAEACNDLDDDCDGVVPADEIDNDGDGFDECADGDCDDANNSVFAGSPELCNGIDDNCAGGVDEPFDGDSDGYFDAAVPGCVAAYGAPNVDCDDAVTAINPGATEVCNTLDDDCSGVADEPFDIDGDGYFEESACTGQYASLDCNDNNANVNPGLSEDCANGIDDDCDGSIDIGFDVDGDGVDTCNGDCNDNDAAINPVAAEVCDLIDNDCDQQIDEGFDVDSDGFSSCDGDCDDAAATTNPSAPELCDTVDNDCDGSVDEDFDLDQDGTYDATGVGCSAAWSAAFLDCDDGNANINPAAAEVCDQVDNDCDVDIDEDFDVDGDGAFDVANANCAAIYGSAADCDDADVTSFPGAMELCDGVDNDCDTVVPLDEIDNDVDGYVECIPESNHVGSPAGGGDCEDGEAAINPAAAELCNLIDEDCDGDIDEDFDADGDGSPDDSVAACQANYPPEQLDCDDTDPSIGPGVVEVCDGIDQNCDGNIDETFDADVDGTFDANDAGCVATYLDTDCDDSNPNVFPGNVEVCGNGIDDNCNGQIDEDADVDGDGYFTCSGDCDDDDANINPGVVELCDGIDQNCDFVADELFDGDGDGFVDEAACAAVYPADQLDCDDTAASINPDALEECNGLDDDCDEDIDELFDLDEDGYFDRLNPGCIQTYGAPDTDCDDLDPTLNPGADEVCNALDDDCDGLEDEGFDFDQDGVWADDPGCNATYGGPGDCDDNNPDVHPGYDDGEGTVIDPAPELCDGLDNDCDGVIAEDVDGDGFVDGDFADCAGQDDLDCDDEDADVNPDADEICDDTIDNDCDEAIDGDDPDCVTGDDDDDATGDDDDDDDSVSDPVVDLEFDGDGLTLAGGCDSCLASQSGDARGTGFAVVLALGLLGLGRRRRQRQSGRGAMLLLAGGLLLGAVAAPSAAVAQSMEQEAERQLDFAWKELEGEAWEKAIASAESALRLNPALYTAMVVKALAYEGMGELRKAESWLQTYLELTRALSQAPEALALAERLKNSMGGGATGGQVKAETTATVGSRTPAFGAGNVTIGGLLGLRNYRQTPCAAGEGCEGIDETRPGFWATNSNGFGGGLSVRAEYFFGGWLLGARVRYDLRAGEPVGAYGVTNHGAPGHRMDVNVVFRPQLVGGLTSVRLMADVGYGFRSWTVYETVAKGEEGATDTAAAHSLLGHQVGGGVGVRIEPGNVVGIDFRYGLAGLIGGSGGINDHNIEVGVGIRPVGPLFIRAAFDMHMGQLFVESTREGSAQRAQIDSLRVGAHVGAGVSF